MVQEQEPICCLEVLVVCGQKLKTSIGSKSVKLSGCTTQASLGLFLCKVELSDSNQSVGGLKAQEENDLSVCSYFDLLAARENEV